MRADYDADRQLRRTRRAPFAELTRAMRAWAEASRDEPADEYEPQRDAITPEIATSKVDGSPQALHSKPLIRE
ncbi:hypothetical protein [Rhizobacter fulvus]